MSEEKNKTEVILIKRFKTLIKETIVAEKEVIETAEQANQLLEKLQKSQQDKVEYNKQLEQDYSSLIDANNKVHFLTALIDDYISKVDEYDKILKVAKVEANLTEEEEASVNRFITTIAHPYKVVGDKVEDEDKIKAITDDAVNKKRKEILANFKIGYENTL